jgi:hypothetical protein
MSLINYLIFQNNELIAPFDFFSGAALAEG